MGERSRYFDAICLLGRRAALNILYGIPKQTRTDKLSGVYEHHILHPHALLTRGFDDSFLAPHSRYADFPAALIRDYTDLEILAETEEGMRTCLPAKINVLRLSPVILNMTLIR